MRKHWSPRTPIRPGRGGRVRSRRRSPRPQVIVAADGLRDPGRRCRVHRSRWWRRLTGFGAEALVVELSTPGGEMQAMRKPSSQRVPRCRRHRSSSTFRRAVRTGRVGRLLHPAGRRHRRDGAGDEHRRGSSRLPAAASDIPGAMGEKVTQDAAATIRSLAARRGRDEKLAESAVTREQVVHGSRRRSNLGLVDLVAPSLQSLLVDLDGRVVEKRGRETERSRPATRRYAAWRCRPSSVMRSIDRAPERRDSPHVAGVNRADLRDHAPRMRSFPGSSGPSV